MAEQFDLITPDQAQTGTTFYKVVELNLNWSRKAIKIILEGAGGLRKSFTYEGQTAETMMIALNKANLTTKSLHRRILERLATDGHLTGTVAGSPD